MKILSPFLLLFIVACATPANKETTSLDSVAVTDDDTLVVESSTEVWDEEVDGDTSQLHDRFEEIRYAVDLKRDDFNIVSVSTRQYEAGSEVTWYFDDAEPVYFSLTWSAEGNEGEEEFHMKDGDVICAITEENEAFEKWCRSTGGTRSIMDTETGDNASVELLPANYGSDCNASVARHLETLKAILKEVELVKEEGGILTLRIERKVNYGQDFTESTEVYIPKALYGKLK